MSQTAAARLTARQRAMLAEMGIRLWNREPERDTPRPPTRNAEAGRANGSAAQAASPQAVPGQTVSQPVARVAPAAVRPLPPPPRATAPAAAPSAPDLTPRPAPEIIAAMDWATLETTIAACRACALCAGRTQTVFGVGSRRADWMVVGEAPGEQEDRLGQPFVGPSGKLLDNMLAAIGISRLAGITPDAAANTAADGAEKSAAAPPEKPKLNGVYIANVLKCRPPGNRNPQPDEVACCEPYLRRQVALLQPKIILTMGRFAVQSLLQTADPIGRLRGRVHQYQGVPVIVTYHPAYLLRSLPEKAKAWQDLCLAAETAR
jgi:DNA polymerase